MRQGLDAYDWKAEAVNILFDDPGSRWPKGESISLVPETEHERLFIVLVGNFAVRNGWDALIESDGNPVIATKLFLIPKAAKAK